MPPKKKPLEMQPPEGIQTLLHKDGDTMDIIRSILSLDAEPTTRTDSAGLAAFLLWEEGTKVVTEETLRALYLYVTTNFRYKEDPEGQQLIKTPRRVNADKFADCKSLTTFITSILQNWGIPYTINFVKFGAQQEYSHVYPVAYLPQNEVPLDTVLQFQFGMLSASKDTYFGKHPDNISETMRCGDAETLRSTGGQNIQTL